ncbi:MAG: septum formation initiator family protein [Sphingobacteriales bacterium]|nr:MAG: septum formation initiator family protein [Sphingobacteriales bacterium]
MKKLFRVLTNKFLLTGLAFAVWMIYFDQNNWSAQEERKKELKGTERNIAYLEQEISRMEKEHRALVTDPERLEQYAREHYKMKRDTEDLYIIER